MFLLKNRVDEFADKSGVFFAGPPLYIPKVDQHMRGMPPQTTTTLAGVSGVGKSSMALHVAAKLTTKLPENQVVLYCLNEMGPQLFIDRLVSWLTRIPGAHIMTGDFSDTYQYVHSPQGYGRKVLTPEQADEKVRRAYSEMRGWNLAVAHSAVMTTFDIESWLNQLYAEGFEVPLVVIDYVGNLKDMPKTESTSGVQDFISGRLVSLSQDYHTHVLGIKDFNRIGEMASGVPPLHALRGTTRIRYASDYIIFMSSPTLNNMTQEGDLQTTLRSINVTFSLLKSRNAGVVGSMGTYTFFSEAGFFNFNEDYDRLSNQYGEWEGLIHEQSRMDKGHERPRAVSNRGEKKPPIREREV